MKIEEIEARELEGLYDEKRDKLNSRLPVWSLLIGLFSAFGYAGLQPGIAGYVVVLYPLLAGCVARFAGHSEQVLDRVKRRIYQIEEEAGYHGYEHANAGQSHGSGAHIKALRDVILLTDVVAIVAIMARLFVDHMPALALVVVPVEAAAIAATCVWLLDEPAHRSKPTNTKRNGTMLRNGAVVHTTIERRRTS